MRRSFLKRELRRGFLLILAGACASGCVRNSPLGFGEALKTGGRTALSHWEYREALAKLYQAQVFLNLIRIIEYGEAPIHFKFSDFSTKIDDTGEASLGIELLDSPTGRVEVSGLQIPIVDNPVTFKPMLKATRKVTITAKAEPITNANWIFDWYYSIAYQQVLDPALKWYLAPGDSECCEDVDESAARTDHLPSLRYRNRTYTLKGCFSPAVQAQLGSILLAPGRTITPREELGSLTTILSFLSNSRPRVSQDATELPLAALKVGGAKESKVEYEAQVELSETLRQDLDTVSDRMQNAKPNKLPLAEILSERKGDARWAVQKAGFLKGLGPLREAAVIAYVSIIEQLRKGGARLRLLVPQGSGRSVFSTLASVTPREGAWDRFRLTLDRSQAVLLAEARKIRNGLRDDEKSKLSVLVEVRLDPDLVLVSPTRRMAKIVQKRDKGTKKTEVDVLNDILTELRSDQE